jgi:hypothetical protein
MISFNNRNANYYGDNQLPEHGSRAKSQNVGCIKYTSDIEQYPP